MRTDDPFDASIRTLFRDGFGPGPAEVRSDQGRYVSTSTPVRPRRAGTIAAVLAAVAVLGAVGLAVQNHDAVVPASRTQGRQLFLADPGEAWQLVDIDSQAIDSPDTADSVVSYQATFKFARSDGAALLLTVMQKNGATPPTFDNADVAVATAAPGLASSSMAPTEPAPATTADAGTTTRVLADGAIATVAYSAQALVGDAEVALASVRAVTPTEWTDASRRITKALQALPSTVIAKVGDTIVSRRSDGARIALCAHSKQRPDGEICRRVERSRAVVPADYSTSLVLDGTWIEVVHVDTPAAVASALTDHGSYKATTVSDGTGTTVVFTMSASTKFAQFSVDTAGTEHLVEANQPALVP